MKKIISLLASLAMIASVSVTAFAAIPADATAPKGAVTIEDTGARDGALGLYTMSVDLTDLGTLTHNKISLTKFGGTKIVQFNFDINGSDMAFAEVSGGLSTAGWTGTGDSTEFTGIYASYVNTTAKTAYPYEGLGLTSTTSCNGAVVLSFYAIPGAHITISNGTIGYGSYNTTTGAAEGAIGYLPVTFNETSFTLPGAEPPAALDLQVTQEGGKHAKGYIWKADVTKGADDLTSFTADFTANGDSAHRQITNFTEFANKFSGGKLTFHIGLKTTKELTGASFTITDAKGSKTATGTVNK